MSRMPRIGTHPTVNERRVELKVWRIFTLTAIALVLAEVAFERFLTWLPPAVQTGLVAVALPVAVALLLVAYFDWRRRMKDRIVGSDQRREDWSAAA